MKFTFSCPKCGYSVETPTPDWRCPNCGTPLNAEPEGTLRRRTVLGEGNTPTVKIKRGNRELFFKLEYLNPSGSFKDRGTGFTAQFFESNKKCLTYVEDSSGNTGVSTATFAAKLRKKAVIFAPKTIAKSKAKLLSLLGATLKVTETREEAYEEALRMVKENPEACYIGHMVNPIFNLGMSFIVDEVLRDAGSGFTDVILPLASGTLLLGAYQGFKRNIGRNGGLPRMWAVQPTRTGYLRGKVKIVRDTTGSSELADALVVKSPARMEEIVEAINSSGGGGIIVNDDDIKNGMKALYSLGFLVEPSSSVVWTALEYLEKENLLGKKVLIPLTGSGLKYIEALDF
ncbi:MAG: pyridoxal-phosphate dependent enzyme [Fervidicoccaceae archaeon]